MTGIRQRSAPGPVESGSRQSDDAAHLRAIRRQGEDLLAAADAAVERALSNDSEAFLRANRQQSGQ